MDFLLLINILYSLFNSKIAEKKISSIF